jgi:phosphoribosylaminoimidazolecarboxamide formyltransferase/IMP cyclohydrolase
LRAYEADPLAAFGGIVALNRDVDLAAAQTITSIDKLLEVIVAPRYADDALKLLRERWKNVRLLEVGDLNYPSGAGVPPTRGQDAHATLHVHKIVGGYLVQQRDLLGIDEATWKVVTSRPPQAGELADLKFAWLIAKHVKATRSCWRATGKRPASAVGASIAWGPRASPSKRPGARQGLGRRIGRFFSVRRRPETAARRRRHRDRPAGGSVRDRESIEAVNQAGAAMIFTGQRHFRH